MAFSMQKHRQIVYGRWRADLLDKDRVAVETVVHEMRYVNEKRFRYYATLLEHWLEYEHANYVERVVRFLEEMVEEINNFERLPTVDNIAMRLAKVDKKAGGYNGPHMRFRHGDDGVKSLAGFSSSDSADD